MNDLSQYRAGYNNGWADAVKTERENKKAKGNPGCLGCGEPRTPAFHAANGRYICTQCATPAMQQGQKLPGSQEFAANQRKTEQQRDGEAHSWRADVQKVLDALDPDDWCGDESMISALTRALSAVEQPSAHVALSDDQIAEVIHLARQQWQNAWTYTPAKIAEIVADSAAQTGESK